MTTQRLKQIAASYKQLQASYPGKLRYPTDWRRVALDPEVENEDDELIVVKDIGGTTTAFTILEALIYMEVASHRSPVKIRWLCMKMRTSKMKMRRILTRMARLNMLILWNTLYRREDEHEVVRSMTAPPDEWKDEIEWHPTGKDADFRHRRIKDLPKVKMLKRKAKPPMKRRPEGVSVALWAVWQVREAKKQEAARCKDWDGKNAAVVPLKKLKHAR